MFMTVSSLGNHIYLMHTAIYLVFGIYILSFKEPEFDHNKNNTVCRALIFISQLRNESTLLLFALFVKFIADA
jgi:hypothetical protein